MFHASDGVLEKSTQSLRNYIPRQPGHKTSLHQDYLFITQDEFIFSHAADFLQLCIKMLCVERKRESEESGWAILRPAHEQIIVIVSLPWHEKCSQ